MTLGALSSSPGMAIDLGRRRVNLAVSGVRRSPAKGTARTTSAPRSRCLRHKVMSDEYSPSRRNSAPLSAFASVSYSAKILALYFAE